MRVILQRTLRQFWEQPGRGDAEEPLKSWFHEVSNADWKNPAELKSVFRSASVVGNNRVVLNIAGNKYRLVVRINYHYRIVYVRFVGTHREYDAINPGEM